MDRQGKLKLNTVTSLLNQIVTLICGFILPRLILSKYGSSVNGLVSSITQFLGLITLCELGVGAVVQSSLYKPLAENDTQMVSKVMVSARKFFNKVGFVLFAYVIILMVVYPINVLADFDFIFTALLIGAISISYFAQYFLGITNQILLNSDQKAYIPLIFQILTTLLNTLASVLLINGGASIQIVKLTTSIVFLIRPFFLFVYVRKKYNINYSIRLIEEPITQKWNGLAQHMATVVQGNTPTIVLTFFSTLAKVSVFNVYNLIATGLKQIVLSLTTGVQSLFGNMLAKNEDDTLRNTFNNVEWWMHTITVVVFTLAGILVVPFVRVYTDGITDVNYIEPLFGVVLILASAVYCIRLPYSMIVLAAGHYKQTQKSAIVEMIITIIVSLVMVFVVDLIGVAIALFVSMLYRTLYYVIYLKKNIINRNLAPFVKQIIVDLFTAGCIVVSTIWLKLETISYYSLIFLGVKAGVIAVAVTFLINLIFFKKEMINFVKTFIKRI